LVDRIMNSAALKKYERKDDLSWAPRTREIPKSTSDGSVKRNALP
jgi:hypothetical protein